MSGSTDASTIAERTKLEAELRELQEGLNDTYYGHAMDSQQNALDDELEAFTKSSEDYIKSLRESIKDTDLLIEQTFTDVMQNGDIVLETLTTLANTYGFKLDEYLTAPWENATSKSVDFDTYATKHFNSVYDTVNTKTSDLTEHLKTPWEAGEEQAKTFSEEAQRYMGTEVVEWAEQNYKQQLLDALEYPWDNEGASESWGKGITEMLTKKIGEAEEAGRKIAESLNVKTDSYEGGLTNTGGGEDTGDGDVDLSDRRSKASVTALQEVLNYVFNAGIEENGLYTTSTKNAVAKAQKTMGIASDGWYGANTRSAMVKYIDNLIKLTLKEGLSTTQYKNAKAKLPAAMYAKGTLGTTHDQWAITDESWLGEEITLAAGKNGQLQYLKKGSAVMPADISANLVEWGKLNPSMLNASSVTDGINLMSNYINKPELKLDIENFLKVDRVDRDTLPELEKLMDKKIDTFAKQLNASLRKFK